MLIGILAKGRNNEFGLNGDLPWGRKFPTDLRWFKWITSYYKEAVLVCGSTTAATLPPLPGRELMQISRDGGLSIDDVIEMSKDKVVIVIGGANIFGQLESRLDIAYQTVFEADFDSDTKVGDVSGFVIDESVVRCIDGTDTDARFTTIVKDESMETPVGFSDFLKSIEG